jgi:hypothetical protein
MFQICNPFSIPNPWIKARAPRPVYRIIHRLCHSLHMNAWIVPSTGQAAFYSILYNSLFSNRPTIRTIPPASLNKPRSSDQETELAHQFCSAHSTVAPHPPLNSSSSHTDRPPQKRDNTASSAPTF